MVISYALSTALFRGADIARMVDQVVAAGFHEVELSGDKGPVGVWLGRLGEGSAQVVQSFTQAGVLVQAVHPPATAWDNDNPDDAAREASLKEMEQCVRMASRDGIPIVIYHANMGTHPFLEEEWEANFARARESLERVASLAQELGVKLAVENLPAREIPRPTAKVSEVLRLIEGLGDHVGICLDAGHSNANGISAAEEVLEAGEKLFALHIQDNDGRGRDQHLIPGQGTTDWEAFLEALEQIHFQGVRTFEVAPGKYPETILAALDILRQMWEVR
ncbi:MAG: sugar phosphate isomerase/epimerase [Anaerolineae bacterium]|nr:sugar phosphate isomerase/epimerase [Anaerolineae bacterium]